MKSENMKLSEHFELGELTKTKTGINNVPNEEQVNNLKRCASDGTTCMAMGMTPSSSTQDSDVRR